MAVGLGLGMVLALDTYLRKGSPRHLVLGAVAAWLCALVKITTLVPWSVLLVFAALSLPRTRRGITRSAAAAVLGPGVGLLLATLWSRYADSVKSHEAATRFLTSSELADWNFGSVAIRLSATSNQAMAYHALVEVGGPLGLGLITAAVGARVGVGSPWHRGGLAMTFISGPLVLFNLYAVHSYYWVAVLPALAALAALGIVALVDRLARGASRPARVAAMLTGVFIMVAVAVPGGPGEVAQFAHPNSPPGLSARVAAQTAPDEQLLVVGCDWDPTLLYAADRTGFMIRNTSKEAEPSQRSMSSYRHLVSCNASIDPSGYLPEGWRAVATADNLIYLVVRDAA